MKVKKLKAEWKPSENPGLQIGEIFEITDAKALILSGTAVAVGDNGEELDSFDLYGVVSDDLMNELREMKKAKHAEQIKVELEAEKEELEAQLAVFKAGNAKKAREVELNAMEWQALRKEATEAGVLKPKMKKPAVVKAMLEAEK